MSRTFEQLGVEIGESPWLDIAGYGLLGAQQHEERMQHECPGNASAQDAPNKSKATADSAAQTTRPTTSTKTANASSRQQNDLSPAPEPVATPAAMEAASQRAEGQWVPDIVKQQILEIARSKTSSFMGLCRYVGASTGLPVAANFIPIVVQELVSDGMLQIFRNLPNGVPDVYAPTEQGLRWLEESRAR